ncbi:methyltransferase [Streptomyces litchfieldiae]|uniref:Methyltransferase n=1 Tax=Streptomyces litchfieldiae TaxID=3075543 RepID=A0ABU2MZ46_9ACTN|nr:methyltransferase [Streptomyces sp. DSM 44938]MDT0346334.1 methyltransferase [Streptomyces sp. DSM 44938]
MAGDETTHPDHRGRVIQLAFGTMAAQTLRAAVELGIVELIGDGERTAGDVARGCGTQPVATLRLLRALASLGLLAQTGPDTFAVTSAGGLLDGRRPDSVAAFVRVLTNPVMTRGWERLADSVRTGERSFDAVFGTDFFDYLRQRPELSAEFNTAMSQGAWAVARVLPTAYDFGPFSTVVDVGGGDGTLLTAVLRAHPHLRGIVYDTAEGLAQAKDTFERAGVADRAETVIGDFFASVPSGGDLYLLKSVIHDWNDEQSTGILRRCAEALPAHGRVLIVDELLPERADAAGAGPLELSDLHLSDLNMLVTIGGRERTREDFTGLCHAAGLATPVVTPLPPPFAFALVEAALAG